MKPQQNTRKSNPALCKKWVKQPLFQEHKFDLKSENKYNIQY